MEARNMHVLIVILAGVTLYCSGYFFAGTDDFISGDASGAGGAGSHTNGQPGGHGGNVFYTLFQTL